MYSLHLYGRGHVFTPSLWERACIHPIFMGEGVYSLHLYGRGVWESPRRGVWESPRSINNKRNIYSLVMIPYHLEDH